MELTNEQAAVVASKADLISVNAFAGAGKTSTLRAFANERPESKTLFIAFNRQVAQDAQKKMPSHVTAKTSHALAFSEIAQTWPKQKLSSAFNAWAVRKSGLTDRTNEAQALVEAINRFCQSSLSFDAYVSSLPDHHTEHAGLPKAKFSDLLRQLWQRMIDPSDVMPATHDTYFKLWQLSRPKLEYDLILLDEAQDTNPALLDVFLNQQHAQRVLVGDEHQNIYGFRGAINAMQKARTIDRFYLTCSFRFGKAIADAASLVLKIFKDEPRLVVGAAKHQSHIALRPRPNLERWCAKNKQTSIARRACNAT